MLAYVFSHRPAAGVDVPDYEGALRQFHAALAASAPNGFMSSTTYRVGDRYSDWYLVDNSAALDTLNQAAVTGARSPAHDSAARMAADGVGKLYSLAGGQAGSGTGFEIHFSKPAGMSYADLYELMQPFTGRPDTSLWRRMMVLGPPPEFCLASPSEHELPREFRPEVLRREPV
jgi:hypothetical protein